MAIFNGLSNKYISVTQEILRRIYKWKKVRTNLAKVFNNSIFIGRALKEGVFPIGFRRRVNTQCLNEDKLSKTLSTLLMKENLRFLKHKLSKLKLEEIKESNHINRKLNEEDRDLVLKKIIEDERQVFMITRDRQIKKFDRLVKEKYEGAMGWGWHDTGSIRPKETEAKHVRDEDDREKFINLSDKVFNKDETRLLNRNLEFIPKDMHIKKLEVANAVESTLGRLKLKDDTIPMEIRKVYTNNKSEKDNLSLGEREALKKLRKEDDLVIANSDKGKVTVVVNKSEYDRKLFEILLGGDYDILNKDPSGNIDRQIRKVAKIIKKEENQDRGVFHKIVAHHTRHPSVFGTFKIHKIGNPMRIIISSFNSVTSGAAEFTKTILKDIIKNLNDEHMLKNVVVLKSDLKRENWDFSNKILFSVDVKNMFGSINPEVGMKEVEKVVNNVEDFQTRYKVNPIDFMKLIGIVIRNSYFFHEGTFYKQEKGVPMGSGLSPVISDLVMLGIEKKMRELESYKKVDMYRRYRDDYLIVWNGNKGEAQEFLEDLNGLDENLKFTMEMEEASKLPFLDALLEREGKNIIFKVFSKPYASGNMLGFDSFHDMKVKRSVVIGETIRRGRISDLREEDWKGLESDLKENGYPLKFIRKYMNIGKEKVDKVKETNTGEENENAWKGTLVVPYRGEKNSKELRKVGKRYGIKPVFKKCKNLSGWFSNSYKERTEVEAGGVYKITCGCDEWYIGETGDYLENRIKKHKYCVKTLDMNNGIAAHSLDCKENMNWKEATLIEREGNWWNRKIKESLFIQQDKPRLNIHPGKNLIGKWN